MHAHTHTHGNKRETLLCHESTITFHIICRLRQRTAHYCTCVHTLHFKLTLTQQWLRPVKTKMYRKYQDYSKLNNYNTSQFHQHSLQQHLRTPMLPNLIARRHYACFCLTSNKNRMHVCCTNESDFFSIMLKCRTANTAETQ